MAQAKPRGKPSGILPCNSDTGAGIMARVKSVIELNKLKIRLFVEAVLNEGRLELIDELIAADYIGHIPGAETAVTGPAGVRQLVSSRRRAHPGLYIKIQDQIAEDFKQMPHQVTDRLILVTPDGLALRSRVEAGN